MSMIMTKAIALQGELERKGRSLLYQRYSYLKHIPHENTVEMR